MLILIIKLLLTAFFAFVALDSFFKASRIRREMAEEITSKTLGAHLRKRALTAGWIFTLAALAGAASLFLRIAPLGE